MSPKPSKKILIVVESLSVEQSSGAKGRVALIKNLHKCGYDLKVYHYTRRKIELGGIETVAIKENRHSLLFFLSRAERYLRYVLKLQLNKPLEKIFGFSFTLFNDRNSIVAALKEITDFEPHLVLTLSQGGSFRPHHALLKLPKWHSRWMAYMHDPYPAHLYPRPYNWVEPGYFKKWKFILDISEKAKYSAFPSKLLQEWMGSYYPNFLKTGVIIPHQMIKVQTENIGHPEYFNPDEFNLLHAGTLLGPRNPKILVKAFGEFLRKFPEASSHSKLIFLGGGAIYHAWLNEQADNGNGLILSKDYVKFEQVLKMQEAAAVNIILEAKSEISPFLPGKFPHCVQANRPILLLGPNLSESKRLLGKNYPWWSENDDLEKITKLIGTMYLEWKTNREEFNLNKPELVEYLSEKKLKKIMDKII